MAKRLSYEETHRINNDGILEKWCNRCHKWHPCTEEFFYKTNVKSPDGLFPYCKECNIKSSTNWKKEHPDRVKTSMSKTNSKSDRKLTIKQSNEKRRTEGKQLAWQRNNKDKCRIYNFKYSNKKHDITESEWEGCLNDFDNSCAYCGISNEETKKIYKQYLHKEHVIDNGRNDIKNCVPGCKQCNSEKHTSTLNQWYNKDNPKFTQERYHRIYLWMRFGYKKYIKPKKEKRNLLKTLL